MVFGRGQAGLETASQAAAEYDVARLLEQLPEPYRRVVVLFYLEDRSCEEVGDLLSMPTGTVKALLHRGRKKLAALAGEIMGETVHPNDHVNASQSSNDVFPSAIHIAATQSLINTLIPALQHLEEALAAKATEFAEVVKSGRTHLMDATPVTLGQEFGGYAAQIHYGIERVESTIPRVAELPLGGTAVGTGINTPPGFAASVISISGGAMTSMSSATTASA